MITYKKKMELKMHEIYMDAFSRKWIPLNWIYIDREREEEKESGGVRGGEEGSGNGRNVNDWNQHTYQHIWCPYLIDIY